MRASRYIFLLVLGLQGFLSFSGGCTTAGSPLTGSPSAIGATAEKTDGDNNQSGGETADAPPHPGGMAAPEVDFGGDEAGDVKANPHYKPYPGGIAAPEVDPSAHGNTTRAEGSVERICTESGGVRYLISGQLKERKSEDGPWEICDSCVGNLLRITLENDQGKRDHYVDSYVSSHGVFSVLFVTDRFISAYWYYFEHQFAPFSKEGKVSVCGDETEGCLPSDGHAAKVGLDVVKAARAPIPDCPSFVSQDLVINKMP